MQSLRRKRSAIRNGRTARVLAGAALVLASGGAPVAATVVPEPGSTAREVEFAAAPGEAVVLYAFVAGRPLALGVGVVPAADEADGATVRAVLPPALEPVLGQTALALGTRDGLVELATPSELERLVGNVSEGAGALGIAVAIRPEPGGYGFAVADTRLEQGEDVGRGAPVSSGTRPARGYRELPPAPGAFLLVPNDCGNGAVPVVPTEGGVGTPVVLDAQLCDLLQAYDADDVIMLGRGGIFGRTTVLSGSFAVAEVEHIGAFAEPSRMRFLFGDGAQQAVPPLGSVSYPEGVWALKRTAIDPTYRTNYVFHPEIPGLFVEDDGYQGGPRCADPETFVDLKLRLDEDGCLRVRLPGNGTCLNDRISFRMAFRTPAYANVVVILPSTSAFGEWTWAIANSAILFPLNLALASSNCVAMFDSTTNELVICSGDGPIASFNPGSYVRIDFDPALHSVFTEIQGVIDDYDPSNGVEPSSPHTVFVTGVGNPSQRNYDWATVDQWLLETFDAFGDSVADGPARSAKIEVHMRGVGAQTYTDNISFGWDETTQVYDWGTRHIDLPTLGYQWIPGQEATLCFDLSELPDRFGSPIPHDIVERLEDDVLHVALTDDTDVDYLVLKVLRCTH